MGQRIQNRRAQLFGLANGFGAVLPFERAEALKGNGA